MGSEQGQSTLEYAALVLLVLAVLAAGLLAASRSGIAEAVAAKMARAICIVGGGACGEVADGPCVTASSVKARDVSTRVAVVRISGGRTVLRERRSDGSVVVRLLSRGGLGLEVDAGLEVGAGGWRLGGSVGGVVEGRLGRGRTWTLRSDAEADRLLAALRAQGLRSAPRAGGLARPVGVRGLGPPPEPDETWGEQGLGSELRARLGRAGFALEAADLIGARTERAGGARTLTIRRHNELSASARVLGASGASRAGHEELYGLRVDGAGRPAALVIVETLRLDGGARLPAPLRAMLGDAAQGLRAGRLAVLERELDLTDRTSLAVARSFVRALREPRLGFGEAVAVSTALRRRLETVGSARALLYDLDADGTELEGKASLGLGLGGRYKRSDETLRLRAARARTLGGPWRERGDCLRAVA